MAMSRPRPHSSARSTLVASVLARVADPPGRRMNYFQNDHLLRHQDLAVEAALNLLQQQARFDRWQRE